MSNPEQVEKMQIVVDSLRSNPDVVVAGGHEANYLSSGVWPNPSGYWSRTLDIFTHPVKPIYRADELNDFMFGLVPELEPTTSDKFYDGAFGNGELGLGKLYYDEVIGTAALSATVQLNEDISIVRNRILDPVWRSSRSLDLQQRTWVRVFPDAGHLADAAIGRNLHTIRRRELGADPRPRVVASLLAAPMLGGTIEATASVEMPD